MTTATDRTSDEVVMPTKVVLLTSALVAAILITAQAIMFVWYYNAHLAVTQADITVTTIITCTVAIPFISYLAFRSEQDRADLRYVTRVSGQDSLTGGADADVFQLLSASETHASGSRDRILDFELGVDLIDVSAIANFTFIGTAAFSLTPGELRLFESQNGNTKVIMDIDGDGLNDAEITVVGVHGLTAGDFVL